ncbi:AQJ64_40280 family protein [Streptomyces yerevanensis]|uniref:AQJ64_40280 family protein n=1 Tax=Streptomyces yerevanensis TaxID=66378 RepID=UPI000526A225|nr:AQJ64_40280 family protein [Streptomyces yerevanensis]
MTNLNTQVTWVDARERLPQPGAPVAAAITGRYPTDSAESETALGEEFWIVVPMYFTNRHFSEDGTEHRDCFVDSDRYVHLPYGLTDDDTVTHWAELPTLPGKTTHLVLGEDVQPALQSAWSARPAT